MPKIWIRIFNSIPIIFFFFFRIIYLNVKSTRLFGNIRETDFHSSEDWSMMVFVFVVVQIRRTSTAEDEEERRDLILFGKLTFPPFAVYVGGSPSFFSVYSLPHRACWFVYLFILDFFLLLLRKSFFFFLFLLIRLTEVWAFAGLNCSAYCILNV
jgi:hypothetical protein